MVSNVCAFEASPALATSFTLRPSCRTSRRSRSESWARPPLHGPHRLHERQCRSGSVNATSHPNLTKQLFQRAISIENDDFFDSIGQKRLLPRRNTDDRFAQ